MHRIPLSNIIGFLSISLCLVTCVPSVTESGPPNIIIVFTDDMGYGDLGCYGHPNISTPNLDRMAEEGIRFTSFYAAASVCTPSRAGLLTGRYPIRNAPHNFGPESNDGLPLEEVTIADLLQENGYATMAIGKWHLGHQPEYLPTSRGFDAFYGLPYSNDMILPWCPWLTEENRLFLYENEKPVQEIGFEQDELTVNYTKKAVEFIREQEEKPFFLYLAHSMPHLPVSTSVEFSGKSNGGHYGDVIETIDWSMGELFAVLKDRGIDDNTLIIFTSDNGPWHNLPERMVQQGVERWHTGSTGLLRGAKGTTYEGGFRVPGIVRWPGKFASGKVARQVVSTLDLFPTIVKIAGAKIPTDLTIDGIDFFPVLNETSNKRKAFFYLQGTNLQAIRKGNWKLRHTLAQGVELYDLGSDPSEMYNVFGDHHKLVKELYQEMSGFAQETNAELANLEL